MDPDLLRLEEIVTAYLKRGQKALEALQQDDWDSFERSMRWKKAAFLHFRALDHIVEQKQPGYLATRAWQQKWADIERLDRRLTDAMEKAKERLSQQVHRITQHRAALKKFHSGDKIKTGFLDSI